jgi:hypothetical protein
MSDLPLWVSAEQIVNTLGLYPSVDAVHRAAKDGEIPQGTRWGRRFLWHRDRLTQHTLAREGDVAYRKKKRKVVRA